MLLSREWLNEFADVASIPTKDYCDRMTDTGTKVEGYESLAADIINVYVCKILSIDAHPQADKLVVCTVDDGEEKPLQIVTAAHNMKVGDFVPVCRAPAELPGGVKIKAGKLRGVESFGMFCSIAELGLTLHEMPYACEDGLLILNDDPELKDRLTPGEDIRDTLRLRDDVVDFEITSNRPDCLSMIGLARETAASYDIPLKLKTPAVKGSSGNISDYLKVSISSPLCRRYAARIVRNIRIAPSPLWLRMRLRAMGVRAINNIVDITNYVMLEYGQPMHAFDYRCIDGSAINVREAYEGETFVSLDDQPHELKAGMLVIADEKKAVALAGVMGGQNSEITDTTENVIFESANFNGASVRVTSRALGMRTESSSRFEKNLDPESVLPALERACELVELLGAGEVVGTGAEGIADIYPDRWQQTVLTLEPDKINSFLGSDIPADYMKKVLVLLGFGLDGDKVKVPSWREDVKTMNDLAEDIIRIRGYNTVEATDFKARVRPGSYTPRQAYRLRLINLLTSLGYSEIYNFSFIGPKFFDRCGIKAGDPLRNTVIIRNPLGEDTSVMRTTLLPSMLETLAHNYNHHTEDSWLFEIASVYLPNPDETKLPDEPFSISLGAYGGDADFYTLKGAVEEILSDAQIDGVKWKSVSDNPTFHPGRCADAVSSDGAILATIGELHPDIAKEYGFEPSTRVYAGTVDFAKVFELADFAREYTPLPKFPAIERDFAIVCDETVESGAICDAVIKAGGKLVENVRLFDVYRGVQLGQGKVSLAYKVTLRAPDRTLTAEEADKVSEKMLKAIKALGAELRK